ncbi:hypothetical protein HPP92_014625 [Vanilla planifolia]|uniref:RHOMBOID-like protein n=1 Tax=Vanilla planifolia TaxID=51239 RepID=A0A835UTA9_VANPL|nr:hypothetical protein HPP92_014625 [Vanilla planifolia]
MDALDCADVRGGEYCGLFGGHVLSITLPATSNPYGSCVEISSSIVLPAAARKSPFRPSSSHTGEVGCPRVGQVRIGVIYLLSGFGGSILSSLFIRNNISVGASGALFGLLGAMLSELITNWTIYSNKAAALFTLLIVIVINLAVGILPHVDNFAHIGGFLTGFLLGFMMLPRPQFGYVERHNFPASTQGKSKHNAYQYVMCVAAMLLLIAGFSVGLVTLFQG